jgi:hypothetical protein
MKEAASAGKTVFGNNAVGNFIDDSHSCKSLDRVLQFILSGELIILTINLDPKGKVGTSIILHLKRI